MLRRGILAAGAILARKGRTMTALSTYFETWGRAVVTQHEAAMAMACLPLEMGVRSAKLSMAMFDMIQPVKPGTITFKSTSVGLIPYFGEPEPAPKASPKPKAAPKPAAVKAKPVQKPVEAKAPVAETPVTAKPANSPAPVTAKAKAAAPKPAPAKAKAPEPKSVTPAAKAQEPKPSAPAAKAKVIKVTPAGGKSVSLSAMPEPKADAKPAAAKKAKPAPAAAEKPAEQPAPKAKAARPTREKAAKPAAPKKATPKPVIDDLTVIKGVGPKLAKVLNQKGITSYAQIAAWSPEDVDKFDAQLGSFQGRAKRGNWVAKAKAILDGKEQP